MTHPLFSFCIHVSKYDDDHTNHKKSKHQNTGNTRNKMDGPMSKKTNEPPKRADHKGNIKFLIAYEMNSCMLSSFTLLLVEGLVYC
jgi:hypothetical protein